MATAVVAPVPTEGLAVMTNEQMLALIAKLKGENDSLRQAKERSLSCKVSTAGALSVYGLGRWPVTLYKSQWFRLLAYVRHIEAFLTEHDAELKDKADVTGTA